MAFNYKNFDKQNIKKEQSFTSTGDKLLCHKNAITDLRKGKNHPIVLHIMPTELCNLRCVFCSVAQRGEEGKLFYDLTMQQIKGVVKKLIPLGLKAIILSGGGEPTIYPKINELLEYLYSEKLNVGLITNGTFLNKKVKKENLNKLTWIRISINSLDYLDNIEIPRLNKKVTMGFSYIWNPLSSDKVIKKIKEKINELSKTNPIKYVRLLPDCNLETTELEKAHKKLREKTISLGVPFFHQYKTHRTPEQCHLGRVHPVLYTDGYIYPCDSLVLNSPPDDKKFHRDFALCRWDEIVDFFGKKIKGSLIDTKKCPHCVFARQNELLNKIINTNNKLPKPANNLEHINFI